MAVVGGCEFIPEEYFDPTDYRINDVHAIEQRLKKGKEVTPLKWEAGQAYNPWSSDYMGFKGG